MGAAAYKRSCDQKPQADVPPASFVSFVWRQRLCHSRWIDHSSWIARLIPERLAAAPRLSEERAWAETPQEGLRVADLLELRWREVRDTHSKPGAARTTPSPHRGST